MLLKLKRRIPGESGNWKTAQTAGNLLKSFDTRGLRSSFGAVKLQSNVQRIQQEWMSIANGNL
jgi:hypothetical protein